MTRRDFAVTLALGSIGSMAAFITGQSLRSRSPVDTEGLVEASLGSTAYTYIYNRQTKSILVWLDASDELRVSPLRVVSHFMSPEQEQQNQMWQAGYPVRLASGEVVETIP